MRYKHCARVETLCRLFRFPATLLAEEGEEEVRVWKQEIHVRPHEAMIAFKTMIICRCDTPTHLNHLPVLPSVYKPTTFAIHLPIELKDGASLQQYSRHSCSIHLVCVLCCKKRFHIEILELQLFFFGHDKCIPTTLKHQITGHNPISNHNKC